jgi:SAM-dependent methyltransferase
MNQAHWDKVYDTKAITNVSWYEPHAEKSLALIRAAGVQLSDPIIDVGGGASFLTDELLAVGYRDLTVLEISAKVLDKLRERLGLEGSVSLVHADVRTFRPQKRYTLWHDRAVFHFLTESADRQRYVETLQHSLHPGGHLIIATFGPRGPERCSGLPTMRYDAPALASELGHDFQLMESSLAIHQTPWNTAQQFLYCRFHRRTNDQAA